MKYFWRTGSGFLEKIFVLGDKEKTSQRIKPLRNESDEPRHAFKIYEWVFCKM